MVNRGMNKPKGFGERREKLLSPRPLSTGMP